jgi:hypothetical protein
MKTKTRKTPAQKRRGWNAEQAAAAVAEPAPTIESAAGDSGEQTVDDNLGHFTLDHWGADELGTLIDALTALRVAARERGGQR